MMTNFATAPVTGHVYGNDGGLAELMVDAWMAVSFDPAASGVTWDDRTRLTAVPRDLFLVFEQGRNASPYAFALKDEPTWDLAGDDGFGLHYLPQKPDDDVYPQMLRTFYEPVAALIDHLAAETVRPIQDRCVEVMTLLLDRIADQAILRAVDDDSEGGDPAAAFDRDIASQLPSAWEATVAAETVS